MEANGYEKGIERVQLNSARSEIGPKRRAFIKRLTKKFGSDIVSDLNKLIINPFCSLHQIGEKYNITRERVRQIIPELYGRSYSYFVEEKRKARNEVNHCALHPLAREFHKVGGKSEAEAYRFLRNLGYEVSPNTESSCDMIVNGYQVDIKSCSKLYHGKNLKSHYYSWGYSKKQAEKADFFIIHVIPEDRWFVIPNVKKNTHLAKTYRFRGYIRMNEITSKRYCKINSFVEPSQHENNWQILKRGNPS